MDKQYSSILLFQAAGGAVTAGGGGPRCFIFTLRAPTLNFPFTVILK